MQDQDKKIFRWILVVGLIVFSLLIFAITMANIISGNNIGAFESYAISIILVAMCIYLIFCGIGFVKYIKYLNKHESEKEEEVSKELTSEFKQVFLNYFEPISKERFECQAKLEDDGKIVCKIQLDYEVKFESYEEFLNFFHF